MITFVVVFFILGIGSFITMLCGFGMGVFSAMFLPHVMSSTFASSAVVSIVSMVQAAVICWKMRDKLKPKVIIFPLITYMIFSTICITFGKNISNAVLKMVLGVFLVLLSIYFLFFSKEIKIKYTPRNGLIAGSFGGIMGSLFGVGGPPASLYFSLAFDDKETYLCNIQLYFLVTNIYVTCVRAANGIITEEVVYAVLAGIAGMFVGTYFGKKVFDRINAETVKKGIYLLMAASGVILFIGGFKQF